MDFRGRRHTAERHAATRGRIFAPHETRHERPIAGTEGPSPPRADASLRRHRLRGQSGRFHGGASDLDDDEADDAEVETRARLRDVDIGAREEPGDLIDGVETEPSAGSIHSETPTAYEECETEDTRTQSR